MSKKKSEKIRQKLKDKKEKKRLAKAEKKQKKEAEKKTKKKKSIGEIMDIVDLVLDLVKTVLGKFFGHLRVDVARFRIKVATGDPATTAVAYGAISQTVSYLLALFKDKKNVRGIKRADIDISTDFLSDSPAADIKISFSLRVWHVFHIGLAALVSLIKTKLKQAKKKGGTVPQAPAAKQETSKEEK